MKYWLPDMDSNHEHYRGIYFDLFHSDFSCIHLLIIDFRVTFVTFWFMAYLVKRPDSAYWWVCYIDPQTRKRSRSSTKLRWNDDKQTAQADLIRAKFDVQEKEIAVYEASKSNWDWVNDFIERHYDDNGTRKRVQAAWHHIHHWCILNKISPLDVRYKHAHEYLAWRLKDKSGRKASHNTIVLEIKFWGRIMQEAVSLEYIVGNPLVKLGLHRKGTKKKPAFSEEQIRFVWQELQTRPEWMRIAFEIALQTGCRFSETRIPVSDIDLKKNTITFMKPKGGESRAFSIPIPKPLLPLLTRLKSDGRKFTWTADLAPGTNTSRTFSRFFKEIGLQQKGYSFHCLRVTKVTRLFEEGVPREVAKQLVNHASDVVHEIYVRASDHLQKWANAGTQPELQPEPIDQRVAASNERNLPKKSSHRK